MKILLIGADGQLGFDLKRVIPENLIIPVTKDILDITNFKKTSCFIKNIKPDIIINTAAYNRVDDAEDDFENCFLVNAFSVLNLAKICANLKIIFVHFSTDYVFGQEKFRKIPYKETDKEGPINIYGCSKLCGEHFIKSYLEKYFIIRLSGLFGIKGSKEKGTNIIETFIKLGKMNSEIKVVDDQISSPTYTLNAAKNIWKLINTENWGVYHMVSQGECSWYEFAVYIFKLLNLKTKITPIKSTELKRNAKRPNYSVLEDFNLKKLKLNIMLHWKTAVEQYLKEKKYL